MLRKRREIFCVGRIHPQSDVRRQHGRHMALPRQIEGIEIVASAPFAHRLICPGRALLQQLPFIFEQVLEEAVALHFVGVVLQVTSGPPVIVSFPIPVPWRLFQPKPISSMGEPSSSSPIHARRRRRRGSCRSCVRRR